MLKLYFDLLSQPSRAVFIFLKKTQIPFQPCPVALRKGEHHTDEYKKVNPFQLVPAIEHNGFKMAESVAILRYICRENSVTDHWYPKNTQARARVDEYLEWQHLNTRLGCGMYFRQKFMIPMMTGTEPNEAMVKSFLNLMESTLDQFEEIWLKDRPFIAGNQISVADIWAACELEQTCMAGYDVWQNRPLLTAWHARIREILNPEYDEAHKFVWKMRDKFHGIPAKARL